MRKIEQQMLSAIRTRTDWHGPNTAVHYLPASETGNPFGPRSEIFLHGNHIASVWHNSPDVAETNRATFARWPTRTTVSRLRALGIDAAIRKGKPTINGKEI